MVITGTHEEAMIWFQNKLGGSIAKSKRPYRTAIKWIANRTIIRILLPKLLPMLIIKRTQAVLLLELLTLKESFEVHNGIAGRFMCNRPRQHEVYLEIKRLNGRGPNAPA